MNSHLNNSLPFIVFPDRSEGGIIDDHNSANSNSFVINFNKFSECHDTSQENIESIEQMVSCQESNLHLSSTFQPNNKKKSTFEDFSYSIEQAFGERCLMTIEEEYRGENKENYFGAGDQSQRIDPIQEVTFEEGNNDSFIRENNLLFHNLNCNNNNSSNFGAQLLKSDNVVDSCDKKRLRRVMALVKLSKSTVVYANNSSTNISSFKMKSNLNNMNNNKQLMFTVSSSKNNNISASMDICNNSYHKLYASAGEALEEMKHKKGRKKMLLDGIKTEVVDKAFIREFKKYLKMKRMQFTSEFEEDSSFWNEFFQNNTPPFSFTNSLGEEVEYKSFNRNLLRMMFAKQSVRHLYSVFVQEQGKDTLKSILSKKCKIMDKQTMLFYKLYGMNMHKLYCDGYSLDDLSVDDVEMTFDDVVNLTL